MKLKNKIWKVMYSCVKLNWIYHMKFYILEKKRVRIIDNTDKVQETYFFGLLIIRIKSSNSF